MTTCWLCSMCSACSRALEHPRAAVSAETTTTHHPWKLCPVGLFSFALLSCVGKMLLWIRQPCSRLLLSAAARIPSQWCSWNGGGGNTSTEPLNPQSIIGDHRFKQLRKENKYLYRLLGSKWVDQEHLKVFISEVEGHKLLRKHPQNPYSLIH